jgi:cytochrome b561/polyisoprenoid-binding protein YceI
MLNNSQERYSRGAILLHWIIAGALAAELALGFGTPRDASGFALMQFHKSLGITILLLTLVRIAWRLTHKPPPALEQGLNGALAKVVHGLLYVFMLGAPLTGWAIVSTAEFNIPTLLFGVVPWPHLPLAQSLNHTLEEAHELIAFGGIALFLLHVAGALKHHFINRDRVMARMSPGGSAKAGLVLLAAVVALHFGVVAMLPGHEEGEETGEGGTGAAAAAAAVVAPDAAATPEATPTAEATEEVAAEEEAAAAGPAPSWDIQPGGSLGFGVDNAGYALSGTFRRWDGTISMDPANPAGAEIAIEIDLGSATLGDATQDQMLLGSDFFNVAANPTANFRSSNVTRQGNGYRAVGTLRLNGASRPQTINFTLSGNGARRAVSGSGTVDRNAYGVGKGEAAGGVAPNVQINFSFNAVQR